MRFDFAFNWSNVIELGVLLFTFIKFHRSNVQRMQDQNDRINMEMTEIKTKLNMIYNWWSGRMQGFGD